jgi:hypothetical protein
MDSQNVQPQEELNSLVISAVTTSAEDATIEPSIPVLPSGESPLTPSVESTARLFLFQAFL